MKIKTPTLSYGKRLNPARDWLVLVSVGGILVAASLAWNLWLFNRVANGELLGEAPVITGSVVDQATLDKLTELLGKRAAEYGAYESGSHTFIDPYQ